MEPKARPRLLNPAVPDRHQVVPHSACIAGPLYPGRLRRLSLRGPPTASPSQASQTRVVPHIPNPLPHPAFHRSRGLEGWKELEHLLSPNPRGVRREAQRDPQRVTGNGRNSTQQHCCLMTPSRTAHRIHVGRKARHTTSTSPPSFSHRYGMAAALQAATYYVSCAIITAIAVSGKWRCADQGETPIIITTNRHRKSQATSSPPMTRRGAMVFGATSKTTFLSNRLFHRKAQIPIAVVKAAATATADCQRCAKGNVGCSGGDGAMEPPVGSRLAMGLHDDDATDADGNGLKTQRKLAGDRRYADKPPPSSAPPPSNYLMKSSPVCSQREQ